MTGSRIDRVTDIDDLPIRDDLRGQKPYWSPQVRPLVQLSVNENTHGIPPEVAADVAASIAEALTTANRYPDYDFESLREALADYLDLGVDYQQIWVANGSNEVLQQFMQAFGGPGRTALGFPPSYAMHSILSLGTGTGWVTADRNDQFELTPEAAVAAVRLHRPSITFLCTPNNPTGTPMSLEVVEAVYEATDGMVLVDEAYAEFSSAPSAITLLPGRPRLAISRTMSKAFAFAGVRVGYLVADPAVVDALRLVRLPYNLSSITQAAALAALRHAPALLSTVESIVQQRDRMAAALTDLGYTAYRSDANFVLIGGIADPVAMHAALLERDILVRDNGIPNTLRITAGTPAETDLVIAAFTELAGTGR